jgi:hypothetical protein
MCPDKIPGHVTKLSKTPLRDSLRVNGSLVAYCTIELTEIRVDRLWDNSKPLGLSFTSAATCTLLNNNLKSDTRLNLTDDYVLLYTESDPFSQRRCEFAGPNFSKIVDVGEVKVTDLLPQTSRDLVNRSNIKIMLKDLLNFHFLIQDTRDHKSICYIYYSPGESVAESSFVPSTCSLEFASSFGLHMFKMPFTITFKLRNEWARIDSSTLERLSFYEDEDDTRRGRVFDRRLALRQEGAGFEEITFYLL